jgi:hypothetical protein
VTLDKSIEIKIDRQDVSVQRSVVAAHEQVVSEEVSNEESYGTPRTDVNHTPIEQKQIRGIIEQKGETKMAEIDTTMLSREHGSIRHDIAVESGHLSRFIGDGFCATENKILQTGSDIRREAADHKADVREAVLQEGQQTYGAIKDARHDVLSGILSKIDVEGDRVLDRVAEHDSRVADRFYSVGRDLADLRQGHATISKDIELNSLKGIIESQKNTQYLADKIAAEGEKTRTLLNEHKYHDLNRALVERQSELVNCEQDRCRYNDNWWDARFGQYQSQAGAQFAAMQSQLQSMNQNFNSQLSETRQGMVNFGTMAGVGQTSSANNVR